jgi:hypothetical protein
LLISPPADTISLFPYRRDPAPFCELGDKA